MFQNLSAAEDSTRTYHRLQDLVQGQSAADVAELRGQLRARRSGMQEL